MSDRDAHQSQKLEPIPLGTLTISESSEAFRIYHGVVLGRGRDAHIRLLHHSVSRKHAVFFLDYQGHIYVCDLASNSGTVVNGRRGTLLRLNHGSEVQIGQLRATFCAAGHA
jgi:pSer/pThr/pTyr-binding forkhead associated (FHA) protein